MAQSEITLVFFTTLAPAGTLAFLVLGILSLLPSNESRAERIERFFIVPIALVLIGLIASATHLGTPANALYVITGLGRSPLSNEVIAVAVFIALSGASWICAFPYPGQRIWKRVLVVAAMLSALAATGEIALAYSVETIPTWNLAQAPLSLWGDALTSGPLVALATWALACGFPSGKAPNALPLVSLVAAATTAVALCLQADAASALATTVRSGTAFSGSLLIAAGVFFAATALASGMAALGVRFGNRGHVASSRALPCCAAIVSLAACFIVRFTFYSTYMTVGL